MASEETLSALAKFLSDFINQLASAKTGALAQVQGSRVQKAEGNWSRRNQSTSCCAPPLRPLVSDMDA